MQKTRAQWHDELFYVSCLLVVITLPFSIRLNSYAIVLMGINWVVEGGWKRKLDTLKGNRLVHLFAGFYLLHVIGLLYTDNMHDGLFELEKKVGFVVFPVVLATSNLTPQRLYNILKFFFISCVALSVVCLCSAVVNYVKTGDTTYFFYHPLVSLLDLHAVYVSLYFAFCLVLAAEFAKSRWSVQTSARRIGFICLVIYLVAFLVILSSKNILVIAMLISAVFVLIQLYERFGWFLSVLASVLLVVTMTLAIALIPQVRWRFVDTFVDKYDQTNVLELDDYTDYHFTGANVRLAIWKTLVEEVAKENAYVWGTGTGDFQDILTAAYNRKHFYPGDEKLGFMGFTKYNAHSQYFQLYIMFGAIGVAWFLYTLAYLLRHVRATKSYMLLSFLVLFYFLSLTESTLQVQKGIVYFSFFIALLVHAVGNGQAGLVAISQHRPYSANKISSKLKRAE